MIEWAADPEAARASGRLAILYFYRQDRPACRMMEAETFADPGVVRGVGASFAAARVDIEARPDLFEKTIGGRGGLAVAIVDREGDVVSAFTGYATPRAFLKRLEKARTGYARLVAARQGGDLYLLGETYRELGSLRRAEECYRQAVGAASRERLSRLLVMKGRNVEARTHLDAARAAGLAGRESRMLLTEGLILAVERRYPEAVRAIEEALRADPSSPESDHLLYSLGHVRHEAGLDGPALEALERMLSSFPESDWVDAARDRVDHIRNPRPDHAH